MPSSGDETEVKRQTWKKRRDRQCLAVATVTSALSPVKGKKTIAISQTAQEPGGEKVHICQPAYKRDQYRQLLSAVRFLQDAIKFQL